MSDCIECGMWVDPKEPYHPYAACLMFKGCKDGNVVQANLDSVRAFGAQYDSGLDDLADRYAALEARCRELEIKLRAADAHIGAISHGDNCFLTDEFPGNQCVCGKEALLQLLEPTTLETGVGK